MVGTAVSARPVRRCVSGCSETEQGDALRCQNAEQTCRASQSTAEMGIVIPCGVVNLETCSVVCYADAGSAHAEHEKSQCGFVCCLTHSPELLKTGRFDLSTIISWQSSTIKRVVRSTLAVEGYAVSEALESAQWFRHLLTEAHMARSSLKNEKESLKRPALVFTDSDSLANSQERQWRKRRQEVQNCRVHPPRRIQRGGEYIAAVVADTLASRKSSDEDYGKGHPRLFFNSRAFQPVAKKIYPSRTATENVQCCRETSFNCCSRDFDAIVLVFYYYAAENKFERFRVFLELNSRFEFEFRRCGFF